MSQPITYVTSNDVKFVSAEHLGRTLGYELVRGNMDLQEIQSDDGRDIVLHKVRQAYDALRQPVIITDDAWSIPGLNGFPGPYMKYMNDWLTPEDFLRLTKDLTDRRIILQQHAAYKDADTEQYLLGVIPGILLKEIRGQNKYSHITITSLDGGLHSGAELIAQGKPAIIADSGTIWHVFGEWLTQRQINSHA